MVDEGDHDRDVVRVPRVFPLPDGAGNISIFGRITTSFQFPQEFCHSYFFLVFGHDDAVLVPGGDAKVDQLFHDLGQFVEVAPVWGVTVVGTMDVGAGAGGFGAVLGGGD